MSETIKITVVIETENGIEKKTEVTHDIGATLMSTLQKTNLISESFCGGIGKCGRCRVQFMQGAPLPTALERSVFSPEELRMGYRLACMAKPKNSGVIRLAFAESEKTAIITDVMKMSERSDSFSQCKNAISNKISPEKRERYIVAVDLGTTTIAMQLQELYSGKIVATYCEMNPQRKFGADVLSRIQAAGQGHAEEMKESVWQVLRSGLLCFEQKLHQIACICIAGNTTMEHLLMGLPVESLGRSPFTPVEIGLQQTELQVTELQGTELQGTKFQGTELQRIPVYVTPGISTFVGGDIVAGLYYCGLLDSDSKGQPFYEESAAHEAILFLDLGTNGEMALTDGKRMLVTATAAGPAFEGGAEAVVPGSDMVALIASLLKKEIIDETGFLCKPYFSEGLTQKDIRDIQMAKAAVCAGVEILWEQMGKPSIKKIYLAGGFGYYLDVEAAVTIGLLPQSILQKNVSISGQVKAVGNTSLAGAFQIGRDLCTGSLDEQKFERLLRQREEALVIESINLATQDKFQEIYLANLNFKL